MDNLGKNRIRRKLIQVATAVLCNGHLKGFWTGKLYQGKLKSVCVPGLNCYSCPGALGACPIGSLQAVAGNSNFVLSLYVVGLLGLTGLALGRFVCGFLCPFGLIQELLHKIPLKKWKDHKLLRPLSKTKYLVLAIMVLGIPIGLTLAGQVSVPAFCKWLCPAGTLEAGFPLVFLNESLRSGLGALFGWKVFVLVAILLWSVFRYRAFCRFLCPLGAIYGLFNRLSLLHIVTDASVCTGCDNCLKVCKMNAKSTDDVECIRCGKCVAACPPKAMRWRFGLRQTSEGGCAGKEAPPAADG